MLISFSSRFLFVLAVKITAAFTPLFSQEELDPPCFEKIYVTPYEIRCTPEGSFHVTSTGKLEKVRAIRSDWYGTYIVKFKQHCPICYRCYDDHKAAEGYDCPLSKTEVFPHIWCK
ncbi:MAG: hypothetical protein H0X29_01210 [Parachlamydiaceae bacterium]|nr:hypothetical protein [Parachlamydiaceae bacterium]